MKTPKKVIEKISLQLMFVAFVLAIPILAINTVSAANQCDEFGFCDRDGDRYFRAHKRCACEGEPDGKEGDDCDDSVFNEGNICVGGSSDGGFDKMPLIITVDDTQGLNLQSDGGPYVHNVGSVKAQAGRPIPLRVGWNFQGGGPSRHRDVYLQFDCSPVPGSLDRCSEVSEFKARGLTKPAIFATIPYWLCPFNEGCPNVFAMGLGSGNSELMGFHIVWGATGLFLDIAFAGGTGGDVVQTGYCLDKLTDSQRTEFLAECIETPEKCSVKVTAEDSNLPDGQNDHWIVETPSTGAKALICGQGGEGVIGQTVLKFKFWAVEKL
jgi:hypothetical protein